MGKSWFLGKDESEEKPKEEDSIELKPADVKAKLDKIDSLESRVAVLDDVKKTSDRMASFLDEQEELKRKRTAEEAARKVTEAQTEVDDEWLADPKTAFTKSVDPLVKAQLQTSSRLLRKDIFDDNPQEYEYYHGDFKKKVDAYIDNLPLKAINDPASIKNCYNLVLGEKLKEIQEGKLKSRFSAMSNVSGTKPGETNTGQDKTIRLSDEQKKAAKIFGMSEEEYGKSAMELGYV